MRVDETRRDDAVDGHARDACGLRLGLAGLARLGAADGAVGQRQDLTLERPALAEHGALEQDALRRIPGDRRRLVRGAVGARVFLLGRDHRRRGRRVRLITAARDEDEDRREGESEDGAHD